MITTGSRENWWVADFETTTTNTKYYKQTNDSRVILWSLINFNNQDKQHLGVDLDSFMEYLLQDESKTIWFHNLSFDGCFIIPWLIKNGFDFEYDSKNKTKKAEVFQRNNKIYYIKITKQINMGKQRKTIKIIFRDSLILLPTSIEQIGKCFNIAKYEQPKSDNFYDYEPVLFVEELPKHFVEYCKRDTLILWHALHYFEDFFENILSNVALDEQIDVFNNLTLAKLTLSIYKNGFLKDVKTFCKDFEFTIKKEDNYYAQQLLRGGFVQFNMNYQQAPIEVNDGGIIDIKSSYPFQMNFELPYGKVLTTPPKGKHVCFLEVKIKNLQIKEEYQHIPICPNFYKEWGFRYLKRYDNELDFYIYEEEFEFFKKWYNFKIIKCKKYYLKTYPFFKKYINFLYAFKLKFEKENNKPFRLIVKLLLNSIYGKMCESANFDSFIFSSKDLQEDSIIQYKTKAVKQANGFYKKEKAYYSVKYHSKASSWYDGSVKTYCVAPIYENEECVNRFAAAYITTKGRIQLFTMIDLIDKKDFLYCDTDSIFMANFSKNSLKFKHLLGEDLGMWEKEKKDAISINKDIIKQVETFNKFGVNAAKRYVCLYEKDGIDYELKTGLAGIKMDYLTAHKHGLDWNIDKYIVKDSYLVKKKTLNGCVLIMEDKIMTKGEN